MPRKISRIRVGVQVAVHILILGHLAAWYLGGWRGVGGLDFQDFFHELVGHGAVTWAAIFAVVVYGSALVFGRLFCSWGCHFGAFQDLAAWCLRRAGFRPAVVRTRFLHWLPFAVLGWVFLWPAAARWIAEGWSLRWPADLAGLAGAAPWERLPGWLGSIATFLVCGAAILAFLGTRGFCRFVCPYGALFRITDAAAPLRVRRVSACGGGVGGGGGACGSGRAAPCTVACPTAIDVHAETEAWGVVRSVDCVRCHLCIEACPSGALALRARPVAAVSTSAEPPPSHPRTWRLGEEIAILLVGLATFAAVDLVWGGHFLAAASGLGEGALAVLAWRSVRGRRGAVNRWRRVTLVGAFAISLPFIAQAGIFRWQVAAGEGLRVRAASTADLATRDRLLSEAAGHLEAALRLFPSDLGRREEVVAAYQELGDERALHHARELAARRPGPASREILRRVLLRLGRPEEARLVEP